MSAFITVLFILLCLGGTGVLTTLGIIEIMERRERRILDAVAKHARTIVTLTAFELSPEDVSLIREHANCILEKAGRA